MRLDFDATDCEYLATEMHIKKIIDLHSYVAKATLLRISCPGLVLFGHGRMLRLRVGGGCRAAGLRTTPSPTGHRGLASAPAWPELCLRG
jgi:hypothetical protein